MSYPVEYTDEFEAWWNDLDEDAQQSVAAVVGLLEVVGPALGYPYSSDVRQSRHGRMRELRIQHQGRPLRILFAWDPRRVAVLLTGSRKTADRRWYDEEVPRADAVYDEHLSSLKRGKG
jgi:hypothetical protein